MRAADLLERGVIPAEIQFSLNGFCIKISTRGNVPREKRNIALNDVHVEQACANVDERNDIVDV